MAAETVECPNCGEMNPAGRALCHACGRVLRPGGALEADWTPTPLTDAGPPPPAGGRRLLLAAISLLVLALVPAGRMWGLDAAIVRRWPTLRRWPF